MCLVGAKWLTWFNRHMLDYLIQIPAFPTNQRGHNSGVSISRVLSISIFFPVDRQLLIVVCRRRNTPIWKDMQLEDSTKQSGIDRNGFYREGHVSSLPTNHL